MSNRINRRNFISLCSLAIGGATVSMLIPGCSKKTNLEPGEFLKLSSVLTGFKQEELDQKLAGIYLNSLQKFPPSKATLGELYSDLNIESSNTPDSKTIQQKIFSDPDKKLLADTLINYWMSGVYKTDSGMKVSNYQQMYAFKATGYLIPNAQCRGDFGFWQNKPVVS